MSQTQVILFIFAWIIIAVICVRVINPPDHFDADYDPTKNDSDQDNHEN